MGDTQEKTDTVENSSKQDVLTPKITENKPKNDSTIQITSEEKVEKLHESIESTTDVQRIKIEKNNTEKNEDINDEKAEENPEKNNEEAEEKLVRNEDKSEKIEEKPVLIEKKPVPKEKPKEKGLEEPNKKALKDENSTDTVQETRIISNSAVCTKPISQKIIRNQSDIFSLQDVPTTLQTSIFSINGCPSRKLFRKQEPAGHLFQRNDNPSADKVAARMGSRITKENYNDEKRPSSSYRNPLTGSGLSSNDEYKSKGTKRKDGNPLLGLGYDSEVVGSVPSHHRVPPGGYSHKLW